MEILTGNPKDVATNYRWQEELKRAFRDIDSLLAFLELERKDLPPLAKTQHPFPTLVPRPFANRMNKSDPRDPLLLQVVTAQVTEPRQDWVIDPVEDKSFEKLPGLLHKYPGRVLFLLTGACAIHCRYCFRQHFDYSTTQAGWEAGLEYVQNDKSISEIILSGGDPLMRTDVQIADLVRRANSIPHLKRLRIHTRLPVVLPSRVTKEIVEAFSESRAQVCLVLHINHSREIDGEVQQAVARFRQTGALILNQSVLLNGVNSDLPALITLSETLIDSGVIPYYLHLLDPVKGAENYFVSENTGLSLIQQMRERLPGYCVPKLVKEEAGEMSKTAVE